MVPFQGKHGRGWGYQLHLSGITYVGTGMSAWGSFFSGLLVLQQHRNACCRWTWWASFTKRFGFSYDPSMSMGSIYHLPYGQSTWHCPQKGSLVHGFYNSYNPIHGDCAIYFYPGVNSRIDSQWNFSNGYSSTWSKLSNTAQNVAKKTAVSRRGNHPSIPPFVDTCVHAICVHVSSLQVII